MLRYRYHESEGAHSFFGSIQTRIGRIDQCYTVAFIKLCNFHNNIFSPYILWYCDCIARLSHRKQGSNISGKDQFDQKRKKLILFLARILIRNQDKLIFDPCLSLPDIKWNVFLSQSIYQHFRYILVPVCKLTTLQENQMVFVKKFDCLFENKSMSPSGTCSRVRIMRNKQQVHLRNITKMVEMVNLRAIIFFGRGGFKYTRSRNCLERKKVGHNIFDDQKLGHHKMTRVCLFVFKRLISLQF